MTAGASKILSILWQTPGRVIAGILCLLVVDAAQLVIPLVVREVVDDLAQGRADGGSLLRMALLVAGLALAVALFRFAWRHLFFVAARRAERSLRQQIYDQALHLKTRDVTTTSTGEVMALATNDVESVRRALAMGFVAGTDATIYTIFALGAMFWLAPATSLWVALPLPLLAVVMRYSLKAVYERWDSVQASFSGLTERARESIAGVRLIKAYAQERGDQAHFEEACQGYFSRYMSYSRVDAFFRPAILLLTGACMAILLGVGGGQVIDGQMSVGTLIALSSYLGMLTWPMIAAGWMLALIQRASASMERIQTFLDKETDDVPDGSSSALAPTQRLAMTDLSYRYPDAEQPALSGLTLDIPVGSSLGIVGEIGSGKSTLIQLLMRIREAPDDTITIDGQPLNHIGLGQLRRTIAWVPQEPFLFSDTIAANLRLGNYQASQEELEQSCRLASLHGEIEALSEGYQTLLGERGITLSGGQKQRLCLARALLKNAPVLILDDTLSAVDPQTEAEIIKALADVFPQVTALVVSHRVSAVRNLDQIAVLKSGRVIQQGPPQTLLAQDGYFKRMADLQAMEGAYQ